jgi:hypothetical protein
MTQQLAIREPDTPPATGPRTPPDEAPPPRRRTPGLSALADYNVNTAAGRVRDALPPPAELGYFAGLGLLGVLGVLDWPVVLAVGAGTVIARKVVRSRRRHGPDRRSGDDHDSRPTS